MINFNRDRGDEMQVNVNEAKKDLSKLLRLVESGGEETVVIARYGKPIAQLTRCSVTPVSKRIGVAKGKLESPVDLDMDNDLITQLFGGVR